MDSKTEQACVDAARAIINARDFCGDETDAAIDALADHGITRRHPAFRAALSMARRAANDNWRHWQKQAGVRKPISASERAAINRALDDD